MNFYLLWSFSFANLPSIERLVSLIAIPWPPITLDTFFFVLSGEFLMLIAERFLFKSPRLDILLALPWISAAVLMRVNPPRRYRPNRGVALCLSAAPGNIKLLL